MDTLVVLTRFPGRQLCRFPKLSVDLNASLSKLAEVGQLEEPKRGEYSTGQLFLNRVFGYRGVVLFPWSTKMFENHQSKVINQFKEPDNEGRPTTYYQVLMDSRDCSHVTHSETVTFLGSQEGNCAIPGLNYVSHDDIIPYSTTDKRPIHHALFPKFLHHHKDQFVGNDNLESWRKKYLPWLKLSDVHKGMRENVKVTIIPFYMGTRVDNHGDQIYSWRNSIKLENTGDKAVNLRVRKWCLLSPSGVLETISGKGIKSTLSKVRPAVQYSSYVGIRASMCHMWAIFKMEREDGHLFDCKVLPFSLKSQE